MIEFLFYKESPLNGDTIKYKPRWVLKRPEGQRIFSMRDSDLSNLTRRAIICERIEMNRGNLGTLTENSRINEHYKKVPCTPEELEELLRVYKEIRAGKKPNNP